jgi:hypothetical protein
MFISEEYRTIVEEVGETMLDYVATAPTSALDAAYALMDGALSGPVEGTFIVTSGGRSRWRGASLYGAMAAFLTQRLTMPVRVWHTDPDGARRLVLIHGTLNEPTSQL